MKFLSVLAVLLLPVTGHANVNKLQIFVSIAPQKYLLERLGGDTVNVRVMLKPGSSPEFYEPLPKQLAELSTADLYFRIGVPFENHWQNFLQKAGNVEVVDCCSGVFEDSKMAAGSDPHVWTSPVKVMKLATIMKNRLQHHNTSARSFYEKNYRLLLSDLTGLHESVRSKVNDLARTSFIVVHPSWGHFADEYGLRQLSLEQGNGQITPRSMASLVSQARVEGITTVFAQQGYKQGRVAVFAAEFDARIVYLDPLAEDYIANMSHVADSILQSMK